MTQAKALGRKNFALQKRNWSANLVLLLSPFLVCMLLFVLEHVINNQLNARSFRCGCKCVSCCDWIPYQNNDSLNYVYTCYNATTEQPCSPYASCSSYDDSQCGYLYSTADQVGFCEVSDPPLWPSLLQVPFEAYRGPKYPEIEPEGIPPPPFNPETTTVMLYTGENATSAGELMDSMWARSQLLTSAVLATYMAVQSRGGNLPVTTMNHTLANETDLVEGTTSLSEGLYYFGLVMGAGS